MRRSIVSFIALFASCGGSPSGGPSYLVYVRDRQGSVVAAVDGQGRRTWRGSSDLYGLRLSGSGTPVPREFLDRPFDEETGFYAFRYRSYDPATAQWLTPDPMLISDLGSCSARPEFCNPYGYAGSRPGEWSDPDGRHVSITVGPGATVIHMTLGVYGPDAAAVASALQEAATTMAAGGGRVKLDLHVTTFLRKANIPASLHPIHADFHDHSDEGRSEFNTGDSSINIKADAADSNFRWEIALHEILHAAAAKDHYDSTKLGDGTSTSIDPTAAKDDIMGNFFSATNPRITPEDEQEILNPETIRNAGLAPPAACELPPGMPIGDESVESIGFESAP